MAKKTQTVPVSPEVRRFLSENGKKGGHKGGQTTKRLIEAGKKALGEHWKDQE